MLEHLQIKHVCGYIILRWDFGSGKSQDREMLFGTRLWKFVHVLESIEIERYCREASLLKRVARIYWKEIHAVVASIKIERRDDVKHDYEDVADEEDEELTMLFGNFGSCCRGGC